MDHSLCNQPISLCLFACSNILVTINYIATVLIGQRIVHTHGYANTRETIVILDKQCITLLQRGMNSYKNNTKRFPIHDWVLHVLKTLFRILNEHANVFLTHPCV